MAVNPKAMGGDIVMSVDPGYDSTKVCINGILVRVPACVIDITGKLKNYITKKEDGYILSRYISGKDNLVGKHAKALLMEPDVQEIRNQKSGMIESYEKFETEESQINIMTSIGVALIEYEKQCKEKGLLPDLDLSQPIDENSPITLFVGVTLPNDVVESAWNSVKAHIIGHHKFEIETNSGTHLIDITIDERNCCASSQVEEAYLGYVMDDTGHIPKNRMKELPALIIDGGYKTIADMKFLGIGMKASAESNTEHAMGNIYKKVADILNTEYGRTDIRSYNIGGIIHDEVEDKSKKKEISDEESASYGVLNYIDGDKVKTVDVRAIVEAETDAVFQSYIDYLNNKYNNLLEIKSILVCGGTGDKYYHRMCQYVEDHKQNLQGKVHLANYEFLGREIEPVYAICVGMYKHLRLIAGNR